MLKTQVKRPAIAMIELIFALVIMGIVMMSAPMLMNTAAKSGFVAIQQEGINEAATKINMIMGYHWDEASSDELFLDPILRVTSGDSALNSADVNASRRKGTPNESYRSFVRSDGTDDLNASLTATFGNLADAGDAFEDDIDDFDGSASLFDTGEASTSDYVEDNTTIRINTSISYNSDALDSGDYNQSSIVYHPFSAAPGATTNIKSIITTLTSSSGLDELDKTIILRAFSSNIGGYKLEERDF